MFYLMLAGWYCTLAFYLLNQDTSSSVISSESVVVFGFENAIAAVGLNPNAVPIVNVLVNVMTTAWHWKKDQR